VGRVNILTPFGYKDIQDCAVGDEVVYFDTQTGEEKRNVIISIERFVPSRFQTWVVDVAAQEAVPEVLDEDGNVVTEAIPAVAEEGHHEQDEFTFYKINGQFSLFKNQSIWRNANEVCHASDLQVGDVIFDDANNDVVVATIEVDLTQTEWWRLEISGDHSYIADGMTLHNASRYWVLGTANWDASTTTNWSASSGGAGGASVPTSSDDVHFDAGSNTSNAAYTCTVTATANCNGLKFDAKPGDGLGGTVTWAGSSALNVYGSLLLLSGMTRTYNGALNLKATATGNTVTLNSVSLNNIGANGVGGGWTVSAGVITTAGVSNGALIYSGPMQHDNFDSSGSATRSLDISGITLTITGSFNVSASLSLTVNTSSLIKPLGGSFTGGGLTYNDIEMYTYSLSMAGNNTFRDLTMTGNNTTLAFTGTNAFRNLSVIGTVTTVTLSGNQTASGTLTLTGSSASARTLLKSNTPGTPRTITAAAVSLTDVDFQDITGAGAASPFTGTRLGNAAGNSGITFTAAAPKYYVGNTGNWNGTVWALTDGGAADANNFPLPQDTATFTSNSFSANSQTVTVNGAFRLPSIDFSGMTNRTGITFATGTNAVTAYGDLKLTTAGTFAVSGTGVITLSGRNTQTITSSGVAWTQPFTANSIGGTVTLADNQTLGSALTFTHTAGILDLNTKTLSTGRFATSNSNVRTIKDSAGTGKIITTDTTAATVFNATTTTNLTIDRTNAWTIEIGGNTTNIRTINLGASKSWPSITFTNTTANGELDIVSSGTATVVKSLAVSTPPQTIKRTAGTTIGIETTTTGFPSGTEGNLVTIGSLTASSHTWDKVGGGTIVRDYLSISRSTATPATTWYAGANSTDGGNNSGWTFGVPVTLTMPVVMHHLKMMRG